MSFSVNDYYKSIVLKLKALYPTEEAKAMADRLTEHYFQLSPTQRVLSAATLADKDKIALTEKAISELLLHIPLQYVLGTSFFMDMEINVNSAVLIPRPETEEMVGLILKQYSGMLKRQDLRILDIGTGSGCIAIALQKHIPQSVVSATDISTDALKVAVENASKNHVEIEFIQADILDQNQWGQLPECDLIVSNPPYVTQKEKTLMLPNVINYEPHTALFVPDDDPLRFYKAIVLFAERKLSEKGSIWFEINEGYGTEVLSLYREDVFTTRKLIRDVSGKNRFAMALK